MVVTAIHEQFWQVAVDGVVRGYIDVVQSRAGERFRVRRLRHPSGKWTAVGEWWDFDTAVAVCAEPPGRKAEAKAVPPVTRWLVG